MNIRFKYLIYFIFAFSCISAQINQIDPRLNQFLLNSGISIEEARALLEKNKLNDQSQNFENEIQGTNLDDKKIEKEIEEIIFLDKANIIEPDEINLNKSIISDETKKKDDEKIEVIDTVKYFGYNVFNQDPELFQKGIDESVDSEYQVGPGDEIIIMLWGETEFQNKYKISRDGYLFIENIGQVFVNSLTLDKLEIKLSRLLKKVYSSLDPAIGNPTTFFDVSLGSLVLRPLRIFALGDVNQPGAYNIKPATSLFTSLYYFNGPAISGSLRDIRLIRKGKEV